jgi:hypothetical protein
MLRFANYVYLAQSCLFLCKLFDMLGLVKLNEVHLCFRLRKSVCTHVGLQAGQWGPRLMSQQQNHHLKIFAPELTHKDYKIY